MENTALSKKHQWEFYLCRNLILGFFVFFQGILQILIYILFVYV